MQNMTRGSIIRHLIRYAVPMILGNLLQLTYNAADSVIIAKYLGKDALAAVSSCNPVMTVMVLGASGIGIGASVLMSRFYGAGDHETLRREFSTTVLFSTVFSLAVFALGELLARNILSWIHTYNIEEAVLYLRIIFVGFLFTFQYNILSHAMRAIGDSRTPVLFLGVSCALNIALDFLLVACLELGVRGAALATSLSQAVSAGLCALWIRRKIPALCPERGQWVIDRKLLKLTAKSGFLTALQQAAQPVGKLMIQSVVNDQGPLAIDAFNAVCRVDDFACIPAQSIGSGIMTCAAQNRGAGQPERVRGTLTRGLLVALVYFPLICTAALLLKYPVLSLLAPKGEEASAIIAMGAGYLDVKAWYFVMPCIVNALQGYFRGLGRMNVVLVSTILQISIRTLCVCLLVPKIGITGEAYGCFIGWMCMLIFEAGYLRYLRSKGREIPQSGN